ncbi:bifunctional phosphoribosyl-AMP cyclohydrolase/phosphoribosyl-ATP diphosphatase HisIE [Pseudothermotoga thermarum]|uniref:Histidine biosynthesis bifunctional protein HisIE n=1 Tax=Pseudothermotoga thermarum DSM 5069 TaxID=688269 RepID=F7YYS2_9THEM|nr:bifunctional phosphoribosyl-AMP cyclohydrolase/phosphoribosyl-ATP diphosphatase HisIE [Pseudothermotoga thermarum]AEH51110.1 phosphoribosyl-AMP cyclohydrolase; phosphoribosyl-ATP pyrophosphatase [Pseudothermotoga thermarum DSM 5069]
MIDLSSIKFDEKGLVPVVVQDFHSKQVLMVAYMNSESLNLTLQTGYMYYFSRSRNQIWKKGETSGNYQILKCLKVDCDKDALLAQVEQIGNACHTGNKSCFFTTLYGEESKDDVLKRLMEIIEDRKNNPKEGSYTVYLLKSGLDKILKKIGEESSEVIIAAKNEEKDQVVWEVSDLVYHLSVLLSYLQITWDDIFEHLKSRMKE